MSYLADLWAVLKADGIALDETEAAILGAPRGGTISLWSAMEARHGWLLARLACVVFSALIQWRHCEKQAAGADMPGIDYLRAIACLIAAPALVAWLIYRAL